MVEMKIVAFGELLLRLDTRGFERFVQAEAFAARCGELVVAAGSRAATVEAWRPPEEAANSGAAGQITPSPSI